MRHFAHNIGDYAAATAHLSFIEDAAYHRLLRRYYQTEKPLPADVAEVQRLAAARTKEEKAAVRAVLVEFFTLEDDGWHQKRADREIETYRSKTEAARANGTKGGRPPKPKTEPKVEPKYNPEKTNPVSEKKLTTPHSPLPIREAPTGLPPDEHQTSPPVAARGAPAMAPTHDTASVLSHLGNRLKASDETANPSQRAAP